MCLCLLRKEPLCHKWQHAHTNLHPLTKNILPKLVEAAKIKELQVGYSACPPAQSGDWAASADSIRWRPGLPCLMRLSWRLTVSVRERVKLGATMCESMVSVCAWVCRAHHDGKPPTYACDRACICATACHRLCTERNRSRTEVISISMYKRMMPCTHGYCPCTHGVHARMGGNTCTRARAS